MFSKMLVVLAGCAFIAATSSRLRAADPFILIASKGTGAARGLMLTSLDSAAGKLAAPTLAVQSEQCSYFIIAPDGKHLYACNSLTTFDGQANSGAVTAYALDVATAKLTLLNQKATGGLEPAYISLDKNAHFAFVANYSGNKIAGEGGSIAVFAIQPDGSFGERTAFIQYKGKGADAARQTQSFAHSIRIDPSNKFALVCDLGLDKVNVYKFDDKTGTLTPNDPPFATAKATSGPRHIEFHPNGKFAYLVQEMGNMVTAFHWDATKGVLDPYQEITTLPEDFKGRSTTAEIHVHPNGKWLYATNRGNDSIAQYSIDAETGKLTSIGITPTGGRTPRGMEIDPTGKFILATHQDGNSAQLFSIDAATGKIAKTGDTISIPQALCPRFLVKP